jgi:hypothetical protein
MLVPLGENANLSDILHKLDGFFGNVATNENLMQSFYSDYQKESESIVIYASRLEETISKAIQFGFIDEIAKDAMLRNKFWTGLASHTLKNSTRHLYDSIKDFQHLLREIRKVQQEEESARKPKSKTASSHAEKAEVQGGTLELKKDLQAILERMGRLEQTINSQSSSFLDMKKRLNDLECKSSDNSERGYNQNSGKGKNKGYYRGNKKGYSQEQNQKPDAQGHTSQSADRSEKPRYKHPKE